MRPISEVPPGECRELLAAGQLGRVAMCTPMGPRIVPVNYSLHEGDVVFRTTPYSLLGMYGGDSELAFEVDHVDEQAHEGWSVVVLGKARVVDDLDEVHRIKLSDNPTPWAAGHREAYLRLHVREVSGRRVGGDVLAPVRSLASMLASNYLG